MTVEPELGGVDVVLVGSLNPAIFAPAWFAMHRLLPEGLVAHAEVDAVTPQLAVFSAEWMTLSVAQDRFVCGTTQEPYVRLHDLVVRTFKEYLPHTPLRSLGINRQVHFRVADRATQHRLGRRLAPIDPWSACRGHLDLEGDRSGLRSVKVSQVDPPNRPPGGQINVTVEPSARIPNELGVYVAVNDHYTLDQPDSPDDCLRLIGLLEENFEPSLERSSAIIDHIIRLAGS